jgi:hypothetical protein
MPAFHFAAGGYNIDNHSISCRRAVAPGLASKKVSHAAPKP